MTNVGRRTFSKRLAAVFMALAMLVLSMPAVDLTAFAVGARGKAAEQPQIPGALRADFSGFL